MKMVQNDCLHDHFRFASHELITDCLFSDSGLPFLYDKTFGSTVIIALIT